MNLMLEKMIPNSVWIVNSRDEDCFCPVENLSGHPCVSASLEVNIIRVQLIAADRASTVDAQPV